MKYRVFFFVATLKKRVISAEKDGYSFYDIILIMKLQYPFLTETREVFFDIRYKCGECGGNGQGCGGIGLHHILSRVSASPFNAICLCSRCHSRVGHTVEEHKKYLQKTARWVFHCVKLGNYVIRENDKNFLYKNKELY